MVHKAMLKEQFGKDTIDRKLNQYRVLVFIASRQSLKNEFSNMKESSVTNSL